MIEQTSFLTALGNTIQPRLSQKSFEWYTPPAILRVVRQVLDSIELDPASCAQANQIVQAERFYDRQSDGLVRTWQAKTVWLNPPYCKSGAISNQEIWSCKLIAEHEAGNVEEAILLVNAATETRWFQRLFNYPLCFPKGKIKFLSPTGDTTGPTVGSAFAYFGSNPERFLEAFRQLGPVIVPVKQESRSTPQLWEARGSHPYLNQLPRYQTIERDM